MPVTYLCSIQYTHCATTQKSRVAITNRQEDKEEPRQNGQTMVAAAIICMHILLAYRKCMGKQS